MESASDCLTLCCGNPFFFFFFTRGPKSSQGSGLSQDILFPDGEMFLAFRLCPGVLPMALETLEGKVGVCTECVSEIKVAGKEKQ